MYVCMYVETGSGYVVWTGLELLILLPQALDYRCVCHHAQFGVTVGFVLAVMGFELRAYALSHSTRPFL
jgi:hypothetical protein